MWQSFQDTFGELGLVALGGLAIGILFGFFAQRSRFCLRSAVVEFARGEIGLKTSIWLLTFSSALLGTQLLIFKSVIDVTEVRQLSNTGSLSGAIIGGLLFGVGMILARGCSSRLLVLSATGNLRALLSGLIFAVAGQAALHGQLSPVRNWLAGLWTVSDTNLLSVTSLLSLPEWSGLVIGLAFFAGAIYFAIYNKVSVKIWTGAIVTGLAVVIGWAFTYYSSLNSFEIIPVKSLTFTGPSADALMLVLNPPGTPLKFDIGLVPGVFIGSFAAAWLGKELKVVGFISGMCMWRYIFGAMFMGFGGMLAGGCAVGAGVTGGSIFAVVAWLALTGMWIGGMATDWLIDRKNETCTVTGASTPVAP